MRAGETSRPLLAEGANRLGGDALPPSGEAQTLAGCRLDAHGILGQPKRRRQPFSHFCNVRRELGALGDDHRIDVVGNQPAPGRHGHHLPEKVQAVRARVARVRIGEMRSDIPKGGGTQYRVANRMRENIRVGMAG